MNAFITGITGFVGTHLAEHLLGCGDAVLGCSRHGRWRADAPTSLYALPVLSWDVALPGSETLKNALAAFAPHCIYHLAALSIPRECGASEPTPQAWQANVEGTRRVLELAAALPNRPRVVFASSCHVYAPMSPGQAMVQEDARLGPAGGYGKTKLAAEAEVRRAVDECQTDGVIVRAFQQAGPRQDARLMLSEWCRQMVGTDHQSMRVLSLDSFFDLSDVRDVVRAYRLLAAQGRRGAIYNVGSGVCHRSGDLLERLQAIADSVRPVVELTPGITQQPIADTQRIRTETGWRPTIALDQTLADTLDFWRRQTPER